MENRLILAAATSIASTILPIASAEPALFWVYADTQIRRRLALYMEGLAKVSKNAGRLPRLATVAFDGRFMGLAL